MEYELKPRDHGWVVERVREDLEGQIEVTMFTGHEDKERAEQYLRFMTLMWSWYGDERLKASDTHGEETKR